MDGEIRPKDTYLQVPIHQDHWHFPPISMGAGEIPVWMFAFQTNIGIMGFHINNESCDGGMETDRDPSQQYT